MNRPEIFPIATGNRAGQYGWTCPFAPVCPTTRTHPDKEWVREAAITHMDAVHGGVWSNDEWGPKIHLLHVHGVVHVAEGPANNCKPACGAKTNWMEDAFFCTQPETACTEYGRHGETYCPTCAHHPDWRGHEPKVPDVDESGTPSLLDLLEAVPA